MTRFILLPFFLTVTLCALTSCGSVNFPPGKTYIGADGGDGF